MEKVYNFRCNEFTVWVVGFNKKVYAVMKAKHEPTASKNIYGMYLSKKTALDVAKCLAGDYNESREIPRSNRPSLEFLALVTRASDPVGEL